MEIDKNMAKQSEIKNRFKILDFKDGEEIVKSLKHSGLIIVPNILISGLIILIDFFMLFYFFALGFLGSLCFIVILIIGSYYFYRIMFLWKRNLVIITTHRLIDYERSGFFEDLITEIDYHKIKSGIIRKRGVWRKLFKYGDIKLYLHDNPGKFILHNLNKPEQVLETINQQIAIQSGMRIDQKAEKISQLVEEVDSLSPEARKRLVAELGKRFTEE